jgi:hypothetical protein
LVCLTPKALFASDDIDFACKSTGSSSFNSCWDMSKPASCVYVLNLDTNKVDTSNIYCNSGLACKYKNQQYSCKTSLNPIQDAVDIASARNKQAGKIENEVFLEPGGFTVEQTCADWAENPGCSGFVKSVNGQIVKNFFSGGRMGVQIPSFTQISGTTKDGLQQSIIYIPERAYDVWGDFKNTQGGFKGGGVEALFTLTNVLGQGSADNVQIEKSQLYDPSMQNPVDNVIIKNLSFLGVGGPARKDQSGESGMATDYYCSEKECFYRYTVMNAISGKRIAGSNIKIINNRFEYFPAFIMLGHMFSLHNPNGPQDLFPDDNDHFITQLRVEGSVASPIEIKNNYFDHAIGADSIIVWGSYIDIAGNTVKNGHSDWYGNQIAISAYTDSDNVRIYENLVEHYLTGINLEGLMPVVGEYFWNGNDEMLATSRIAKNNIVVNNQLDQVLSCASVQRQLDTVVVGNVCSNDKNKWQRLNTLSYYSPSSKYQFMANFLGQPNLSQQEAFSYNASLIGAGMLIRTDKSTQFRNNVFSGFPKGFIMDNPPMLAGGMQNNLFSANKFFLSGEDANWYINYANSNGLEPNAFWGVWWSLGSLGLPSSNNIFCNDNQFQYGPITGMEFSTADFAGQTSHTDCNALPTIPPLPVLSPTPSPTPLYPNGDFNQDGIVNIQDFVVFSSKFGTNDSSVDLNSDGIVNIQDFVIFSSHFGETAAPVEH